MFEKILIANRGEIALRIQRACREMGIKTVAVHSEADAEAKYVRLADESVCIGPAPSAKSYLHVPAIIAAAEVTDAEAIHPGYGFLSENADFAERVEKSGFTFVGPRAETMRGGIGEFARHPGETDVWNQLAADMSYVSGDFADAVVLSAAKTEAFVRLKDRVGRLTNKGIEWTRARNLDALVRPGDVIQVLVKTVPPGEGELAVTLDQEPQVEGAFLVIDPPTGQIKSMTGGYAFRRSQFNRATQALRQTGSVIKPFLYTAAVENGFTPATIIQQRVHRLLQHGLFVAHDDLGGLQRQQTLEAVVAVDHPAVQVVQVGGGKAPTVELHHGAQVGRDHWQDGQDHPFRAVA